MTQRQKNPIIQPSIKRKPMKGRKMNDSWIKVEDQLPDSSKRILVFGNNTIMTHVHYDGHRFIGTYNAAPDKEIFGITHWQYLPSPPTE